MKFYIALAVFFSCHMLSTIYVYEMAEIHKLGNVSHFKYDSGDDFYYSVYRSPYGMACYLNNDIIIDCEEII